MLVFLAIVISVIWGVRHFDPKRMARKRVYREMQAELQYLIDRIEGTVEGPFDPDSGLKGY